MEDGDDEDNNNVDGNVVASVFDSGVCGGGTMDAI